MDTQMTVNALLLVPALVIDVLAIRARRAGRTRLGLGVRDGAAVDLVRGIGFGAPAVAVLVAAPAGTGVLRLGAVAGVTVTVVRGRVPAWTVGPAPGR